MTLLSVLAALVLIYFHVSFYFKCICDLLIKFFTYSYFSTCNLPPLTPLSKLFYAKPLPSYDLELLSTLKIDTLVCFCLLLSILPRIFVKTIFWTNFSHGIHYFSYRSHRNIYQFLNFPNLNSFVSLY